MSLRAVRSFTLFFVALFALHHPALAAEGLRTIVTTDGSDYFGFDLRTEQDLSLEQCKAACLRDPACRAFTYNTNAKWCFLKSDFNQLKLFPGAVAGKLVTPNGDPDIGAPPELTFLPAWVADEATQFRTQAFGLATQENGLAQLVEEGTFASLSNDPRTAVDKFGAAVAIAPDDGGLWLELANASFDVQPSNSEETATLKRTATSAAFIGYQASRTTGVRAEALGLLAKALDRREFTRLALSSYEASLALENSPRIIAQYSDLKARKGFRIVDHSVDADIDSPRVCAQFSEELVKTGTDYAQFVTVDGRAAKGVSAKDRQICVEGLEHGERYSIAFRVGLPAAIGEVLAAPLQLSIYVRDRAPAVRFTGDAFVLPSKARRGIPVVTINMDATAIKLFRVGDRALAQLISGSQFLRQLDNYDVQTISDEMGEPVWEGELAVAKELNREVTTSFPIDEALPQRRPGVYVLTAEPLVDNRSSWETRATQWLVVSDLGLATYTGQDGLNVFVRSLASAKAIAGVELTLLAKNNEILGTATTDAEGRATFTPGLTRGSGGQVPAAVLARNGEADFVFLDMTRSGFDLTDRGVEGRPAPGALDVYAYTERGIYRVNETVHVAALARDASAQAIESLPLTFIFYRPDGVEERRMMSDGAALGGHTVDLPLAANAMRGTWRVAVHTDPKQTAASEVSFLVEDFVPDRIEFDLSSDKREIATAETADVTVDGRFLYGAPAAGLSLEGEVNISTVTQWDRFKGYAFGLTDEGDGEATRIPLEQLPDIGDDGKATFPVSLTQVPSTTRLLNAEVAVRMREGSGRAVERKIDIEVRPSGPMIGLDPQFESGQVPQGGHAAFKVIAIDPSGSRTSMEKLAWSLVKVQRNYQWYRNSNAWSYEPVTSTEAVANGVIDIKADTTADIAASVDWGRYRLTVESSEAGGPATSVEFDAGWYVEATSTETPDGLEIALDKETYHVGETAHLKISPHFSGELLIAIGSDRLLATQTASISNEGATIDIPVGADWGAGAYITATLFRPGDAEETRMPARAIGVKWMTIDPESKKLSVSLDLPEKTLPRQTLSIPVSVTGATGDTYVMLAAVDVGILNLTSYTPPDPEKWFFGQRQLGLEMRDLYGLLIDGSLGALGKIRTGGDGAEMSAQGSPPTETLVSFFAGPVKLDAEGKATIDFDLPQFNGTVRVMSVAWSREAVGHATADVIVRDPVVVIAGLPRFLAPGDTAHLRLDIANTDGPAGDYALTLATNGNLLATGQSVPDKVTLAAGARHTVFVPLQASGTGSGTIEVALTHADGMTVTQALSLPIRPGTLPVTTRQVVSLAANGGTLSVDRELLAASLLDGASVSVGVSPSAAFDIPSLLMTLDRYPYGCAEQTASRALPLLYVSELSRAAGLNGDNINLHKRVQDAIYKVLNFQSSAGSFGLWSPGSGDLWLDSYVTDFLTRAREQSYDVPTAAMVQALDNLQNTLGYDIDIAGRGNEIAYALYVLARNKKASIGDLRYYSDTQLHEFTSPMAVAQLAAGLALYGDNQRADATFAAALRLAQTSPVFNYARGDYASPLRDGAAMLALAAESKPLPAAMPAMVEFVSGARRTARFTTTQDEAWMLLAARGIKDSSALSLEINGTIRTGNYAERVTGEALQTTPITVVNRSATPVDAVVTAVAFPVQPLSAGGDGFSIVRAYYNLDGTEANVTEVTQNQRYVVVLKIVENNNWPSRVLVTDLLPAGFEIDNPGLVSSAELSSFDWLPPTEAAHLEFRDDRFVAAFDRVQGDERIATMAYVVRAVTPGVYTHPAATVEDMYRPQFSARTATGMMEVKAP
ncbi:hypothetical protein GA830_17045 [Mesorhizobium sp. NBSH29]|uniref:alpha-2-macroglobulin family protein n=1 Tax=Mesorhizobium sp. NBSH29 TaxID=2654249 RepID=UPI0018965317|nr:alpha-2-macroglobulin family protein [Mesorhizobium sp. NBSH29]QPC88271.1 hypothetical protein GA830_17045 [Mesorhizobium sp. NBSH29]